MRNVRLVPHFTGGSSVKREATEQARLGSDETVAGAELAMGANLLNLMGWAAQHHYDDPLLAEMELGAMVRAVERDPEAAYDNLADDRMLDDQTMPDLAATLVSRMSDLLDDRNIGSW